MTVNKSWSGLSNVQNRDHYANISSMQTMCLGYDQLIYQQDMIHTCMNMQGMNNDWIALHSGKKKIQAGHGISGIIQASKIDSRHVLVLLLETDIDLLWHSIFNMYE